MQHATFSGRSSDSDSTAFGAFPVFTSGICRSIIHTALGTWRHFTAFPILPILFRTGHLKGRDNPRNGRDCQKQTQTTGLLQHALCKQRRIRVAYPHRYGESSTQEYVKLTHWGLRFRTRRCCLRLLTAKSQIAAFSFRHWDTYAPTIRGFRRGFLLNGERIIAVTR